MPNPYATIPLTFDAVDIQEDPIGIFLEIVRGLDDVPSVRGVDTIVPGRAGRIARGREADRRGIELRGHVAGVGADDVERKASYRALVIAIQALFDPAADPAPLVATLEDGSTATIQARTLNVVPIKAAPSVSKFSIELESVDPNWVIEPPP